MKKHLSIHYRQPEFQTDKKLYGSKTSSGEIAKDFLESEFPNEYIPKHKFQSWASAGRRFLFLVKRFIKAGGSGEKLNNQPLKTGNILPDGTFILYKPLKDEEKLYKQVYKEDLNYKGINFYKDLNEDLFKINEDGEAEVNNKKQLIYLFYLNNYYNKLEKAEGLDNIKKLWKGDESRGELEQEGSNSNGVYHNKKIGIEEVSLDNKKGFLNYISNKYKEFGIDYTLTNTEKDFRLQNISLNSNHNNLNVLFKNKPFVRFMLNKFDIYFGEMFRSGQIPFMDRFFINNTSDIDRYKLKERIKVYRLQQSMGEPENPYDGSYSVEKIEKYGHKSISKYIKNKKINNFIYFKLIDWGYKVFIKIFGDLKPKDYQVSSLSFKKYLGKLIDLNGGGITRRFDYKKKELLIMFAMGYYNYRYIFRNTQQPYYIYENAESVVADLVYSFMYFIKSKTKNRIIVSIRKQSIIGKITIFINKLIRLLGLLFSLIRRILFRIGFFINYFTPI